MIETNPYAPPTASVEDVVSLQDAPPLWNPSAAAKWSLLFTPIFGSFLHMKNWSAMGEPAKAAEAKHWAIGSSVFVVALIVLSAFVPDSKALDALSRVAGPALLISWYLASAKHQTAYVLSRYGKNYPRRG